MSDENKCETSVETVSAVVNQFVPSLPVGNEQNKEINRETEDPLNLEKNHGCEGTVIKNVENNESFRSLLVYESDSSSSSDIHTDWRGNKVESEEESSSSSSSDEGELCVSSITNRGAIKKKVPKTVDLSLDELPPIPDLSKLDINVENEHFLLMGHVMGIVNTLVTVEAIPNSPAYDLDTLLFLDGKRPLGFVFDVFGQVTLPIYAIRFNSSQDIEKLNVTVGTKVYSAPTNKHTQYVFLQQLLKIKGTDASWFDDRECPQEFADYSDDEKEYYLKNNTSPLELHKKRQYEQQQREMQQYKKFESTMNKRNLLNTKFNKYVDSYRQTKLTKRLKKKPATETVQATIVESKTRTVDSNIPKFDPRVPPPSLVASTSFTPYNQINYNSFRQFFAYSPPVTYLPTELSANSNNNNNNLNNTMLETEFNGYNHFNNEYNN